MTRITAEFTLDDITAEMVIDILHELVRTARNGHVNVSSVPVPPAATDACEGRGLQVTNQQLAELGPVGASIEAADVFGGPDAPPTMEQIRREEGM